ncbi:adenosine 3'-phospho 5'-phosphosulfate transporter 1 [Drosophila eugracilis]|uniref:adenosine 3'-phospho 5'-phosphosulfate transporter 1 n=1 Tax=Drosophila eugracilis TaxID=29029 RepID=UPI001BDAD0DF|nr:adenosine 3'-phospho 5'-phosphosulfate transporter 1 [Drosophila eugracilis]XP_017070969.2 adenosine 3'-phospho 5'-phosphosulfate transporter 1 [Drosophila eugracilis]
MYAYKMGRVPELVICSFIVVSLLVIHFFSDLLRASLGGYYNKDVTLSQLVESQSSDYAWLLKLIVNCFGYSCVFVPGYLIYKYVGRINYLEKGNKTFLHRAINMCITGNSGYDQLDAGSSSADKERPAASVAPKRTSSQEAVQLLWCFGGLMISYLTWGVLQEKIMTQNYLNFAGESAKFKDSQFLVFSNRLLAFLVALAYLQWQPSPVRHRAPLYKYSYASFSNIMSAWFQYEALKFVNFPTQVLAKSCKIIPVMLMGKLMSKAKYESYEYVTALLISLGMIFFMSGSSDSSKASGVTTLTGIFLLSMYMVFDSFTANWQGSLFKSYSMTPLQMMCGVNLFSSVFTGASLSMQGGFMDSLAFATEHPKFVFDMVVLSVCSAVGQLFIYHTIDVFGPVVFTIIMTLRQAVAIMLSCFIYQHSISLLGIFGVLIVFVAIFLRVYCTQRLRAIRKRAEANKPKMAV